MAEVDGPTTILQAILAAATAKGMRADKRERGVANLLADTRIECVTEGQTWLHHPDYVDTIVRHDDLRRLPRRSASQVAKP